MYSKTPTIVKSLVLLLNRRTFYRDTLLACGVCLLRLAAEDRRSVQECRSMRSSSAVEGDISTKIENGDHVAVVDCLFSRLERVCKAQCYLLLLGVVGHCQCHAIPTKGGESGQYHQNSTKMSSLFECLLHDLDIEAAAEEEAEAKHAF